MQRCAAALWLAVVLLGCGDDGVDQGVNREEVDGCSCPDCDAQPDGFDDPESWGFSLPDGSSEVRRRAPDPTAALCIDGRVNPNGPCLGMCGRLCDGILGLKFCTGDCLGHDCCVRKKICAGMSKWRAHCLCLGAFYQAQASLVACSYLYARDPDGGAFQPAGYCYCNANGAVPGANCP